MTKLKPLMTHVTEQQKNQIKLAAKAQKIGVSEYVRRALIDCGIIDEADTDIRHGDSNRFRKENKRLNK